jgi:hypothetical protein
MHCGRFRYVQVINELRWSICHHKSGGQTAMLHTYHAMAEIVAPVRRNDTTNEVAQGRDM